MVALLLLLIPSSGRPAKGEEQWILAHHTPRRLQRAETENIIAARRNVFENNGRNLKPALVAPNFTIAIISTFRNVVGTMISFSSRSHSNKPPWRKHRRRRLLSHKHRFASLSPFDTFSLKYGRNGAFCIDENGISRTA